MKMTVLSLMLMAGCAYAGACSPVDNAVKTEEPAPEQETAEGTEQEPEEDRGPQTEGKRRFGGSEAESIIREWIDGLGLTFGTGN